VKEKVLDMPLLYLSTYFEKNKNLYYDNLSNVRDKNDMLQWIKYFLVGIEQIASKSAETLSTIIDFKEKTEDAIRSSYGRRSTHAIMLLHSLMKNPYVTSEKASTICALSYKAANDLVKKLQTDGYLIETTGQSRNRMYVFQPYLDLFE
jgi:Fic family protein